MTREQMQAFATDYMIESAREADMVGVHEVAESSPHAPDGTLTDDEASAILDLITEATVTIEWPS